MSRRPYSRVSVELIDCHEARVTLIVPAGLLADLARALDDLTRPGPPAPAPVLPAPEDPRPAYRRRLLDLYDRLTGYGSADCHYYGDIPLRRKSTDCSHYDAPRRIAAILASEGHPWHTVETVRRELSAALRQRKAGGTK